MKLGILFMIIGAVGLAFELNASLERDFSLHRDPPPHRGVVVTTPSGVAVRSIESDPNLPTTATRCDYPGGTQVVVYDYRAWDCSSFLVNYGMQ